MPSSTEVRSRAAAVAGLTGVLALAATACGPIAAQTGVLQSRYAFVVFFLGVGPGMILAGVAGAAGLWRTRAGSGRGGRRLAWSGIAAAGALFALVASFRPWSLAVTLHDATTRIDDPPSFSDAVRARRSRRAVELGLPRVNTTDYPSPSPDHAPPISGEQVVAFQRRYYPDLAPIEVPELSRAEALEASRGVARELGWTITRLDPEAGILEGFDRTPFFAFEDDVVVRVRPEGAGSVVDVRSTSLYRANDMRANATRIRAFAAGLRARAASARDPGAS